MVSVMRTPPSAAVNQPRNLYPERTGGDGSVPYVPPASSWNVPTLPSADMNVAETDGTMTNVTECVLLE